MEYLQSICMFSRQHRFTLIKVLYKKEIYVNIIIIVSKEIFTLYPYFFVYNVMQGISPHPHPQWKAEHNFELPSHLV